MVDDITIIVAFLNVGAVDSSFHPSSATQLTASDLYIAIEYDEPIVVADVPGSWLDEALTQALAHDVVRVLHVLPHNNNLL